VLVRRLIAALLLVAVAVALAGCGGRDNRGTDGLAQLIAGDWTGTLKQKGLQPFGIAVRIETSGRGQVAYTGIECGGTWDTQLVHSSRPPQYYVTEHIDEGAGAECKGSGHVNLQPEAVLRNSPLRYEFAGGGVTSHGVLHRTDAAGLNPVFDEAGVTRP
jgi:hypothetical protein